MNNEEKILALITEMQANMATKADLAEIRADVKADMATMKADITADMATKADLAEIRADVKADMAAQEQRIMQGVQIIIENTVTPRFNLLAEGIQDIREQLIPRSRFDELDEEVKFLKAFVRQISEEVQALKKAQ